MKGWHYSKYFIAIAIFLFPLSLPAQIQIDTTVNTSSTNLKRFSLWEIAVIIHSLESANKIDINAIAFSPDGQLLTRVGEGKITIWDVTKGEIQRILSGHYSSKTEMEIALMAIAFSPEWN